MLQALIVESLSRALEWGHILDGLTEPFADFLRQAQTNDVLDLGSGAAAPARLLTRAFIRKLHPPPHFLLSDLHPRIEVWRATELEHPETIRFEASPIDATSVPAALGHERARTMINVFHHLPPDIAGAVLRDAVSSKGIFIAEGFERSPLRFANFAFAGLPALLATPLLTPERNLQKALLTWLTPIGIGASIWDGLVSTMRVYTERELREMVAPTGDAFRWTYGTFPFPPFGRGYYFYGVPRGAPT